MNENNFLAEGAYGCLFLPYVTCKGKPTNDYKFISKIQIRNFYSENEIEIGKQIRKKLSMIYHRFFVPAIYHCNINIKEFVNIGIDKCRLIREQKKSPFVLLKIPYVGYRGGYIFYKDYIVQDINDREILLNLIDGYKHLLNALILLADNNIGICHFDLNSTNILFSENKTTPVIIDFGLSFSIKNIENNLKKYFFIYYPKYYVWPIEVHYINFLLHKNSSPSYADIRKICNEYISHNIPLKQNFSPQFLKKYEDMCINVLEKYRNGTEEIMDIIHKYWRTWDNYSLSTMYLQILFYLNVSFKNKKPVGSFIENSFIIHFSKLLLNNIHPDPSRRLSVKESSEVFELFFYTKNVNDVENYENILVKYIFNKNRLRKIVSENKKDLQKLLNKMAKTKTSN